MPLPIGIERVVFAGATRPFPAPISGRELDVGYLTTFVISKGHFAALPRVQDIEQEYVEITHTLVERTFVYRILRQDVRALFVPTNKIRPHVDVGDWYYGETIIWNFITAASKCPDACQGIVYARRDAPIWWHAEGMTPADAALPTMRPMFGPGELVPVEFRGLYDKCPPHCCDE